MSMRRSPPLVLDPTVLPPAGQPGPPAGEANQSLLEHSLCLTRAAD